MHTLMSANANTVLSFLIGFFVGAIIIGVHYGKRIIQQTKEPKKQATVVDIDESLTHSERYSWRPEKAN